MVETRDHLEVQDLGALVKDARGGISGLSIALLLLSRPVLWVVNANPLGPDIPQANQRLKPYRSFWNRGDKGLQSGEPVA